MSEALISATNQDGVLEITDGSKSYFLDLEPGDFSVSPGKPEPVVNLTRGRVSPLAGGAPDMRYGEESATTFSFTARLRSLYSTTQTTLLDLALWLASDSSLASYVAGNWSSTHPYSDCRTVTLKYHLSGVYRGVADSSLVLSYAQLRVGTISEANPSTVEITGTAGVVKPTME